MVTFSTIVARISSQLALMESLPNQQDADNILNPYQTNSCQYVKTAHVTTYTHPPVSARSLYALGGRRKHITMVLEGHFILVEYLPTQLLLIVLLRSKIAPDFSVSQSDIAVLSPIIAGLTTLRALSSL